MTPIRTRLSELKDILIPFFLPWPDRRSNVVMWVKVLLMWFLIWKTFGLCWGLLKSLVSLKAVAASLVLTVMSVYCTLAVVGDQVVKATKAKTKAYQDKILKSYADKIAELRDAAAEGIRKAAGRDVNMNPISMTAATIETVERIEREAAAKNPLEAALRDDAESFDELMDNDDDTPKF